jgi:hypothetical protein
MLTRDELARELGVSASNVDDLVRAGLPSEQRFDVEAARQFCTSFSDHAVLAVVLAFNGLSEAQQLPAYAGIRARLEQRWLAFNRSQDGALKEAR